MFYSLLSFTQNLFLSVMPDNGPPVPVFIYLGKSTSPAWFYACVWDVPSTWRSAYIVKETKWYKEKDGSRHEYLVARLQRKRDLGRVNNDTLLANTSPDLSLLEFLRLVQRVSKHGHNYPASTTMGYWFAAMIMEVARRQFSPRHPDKIPVPAGTFKGAGNYMCFSMMTPQWTEDFAMIEQKYMDDRSADPDLISREQKRIMREVQEAEARVERKAIERARAAAAERERKARAEGGRRGIGMQRERAATVERERTPMEEAAKAKAEVANAKEALSSLQEQPRRGGKTV